MSVQEIQDRLRAEDASGWLFFDHHGRDPIAYRILGLDMSGHISRRWYYWIPAAGDPVKLVHRIESARLDKLPGEKRVYASWQQQRELLSRILAGADRVAMQYSPECMIPHVSLVDAGTVDLVRGLGKEVVSSAALVQYFEARWSARQLEMHLEAGRRVDKVRAEAFDLAASRLASDEAISEWQLAEFILRRFREEGLETADGPIVAVNSHSGDPHYAPSPDSNTPIRPGDFLLIDLWAKLAQTGAVYYDITWTGFCGDRVPERIQQVYGIVSGARDKALALVDRAIREGRTVAGCDVDDAARNHIREAGFGDAFIHRTGHSIGEDVHGAGANLDNLETRDERPIIPRTCFSIEPGIYLEDFGVRSEIDCYVSEDGASATGQVQSEVLLLTPR